MRSYGFAQWRLNPTDKKLWDEVAVIFIKHHNREPASDVELMRWAFQVVSDWADVEED